MLQSLLIRNYAIISELEIDFNSGLTIITGETGAGKSILLGALSLILGQRADTTVLNKKDSKCIVEGTFFIKKYNLKEFFAENDLDFDDITILRREIGANGKSRAFINDLPVNLNLMRELGIKLIDIHSQHQNLNLSDNQFQIKVVDTLAGNLDSLDEYTANYFKYNSLIRHFNELIEKSEKESADFDYYQFQFDEIANAKLLSNEQIELEEELNTLNHAEEINSSLSQSAYLLNDEDESILNKIILVNNNFDRLSDFFPNIRNLKDRIDSVYIELKDIANDIEVLNEKVEIDPGRTGIINERLDTIYSLQKKHRVDSIEELLRIKSDLQKRLDNISGFDENIKDIRSEISLNEKELNKLAELLSGNRNKIIPEIEKKVSSLLIQLGIPNSKFKIQLSKFETFTATGWDRIEFLFSANKQMDLLDISKAASGGEISRLMLSVKSLVTKFLNLPTIIFDEIDAGVSGEIADKVGSIIKQMSEDMQVLNITHLPQVASKADHHYLVHKVELTNFTQTKIRLLNDKERIIEIAKMLSGEELTEAAIRNAEELLKN